MLLERLGNRKSAVLVAALYEYLQAHPALRNPECKIELRATHSYPPEAIVELVREMTDEWGCEYVLWVGTKRLITRKKFDKLLEHLSVI